MESRYTTASNTPAQDPYTPPLTETVPATQTYDIARTYATTQPHDPTLVYTQQVQPQSVSQPMPAPVPQPVHGSGGCPCGCQGYRQGEREPRHQPAGAMVDYGPGPFSEDIERATLSNNNYREVIWTGPNSQLVLMSIEVGDDIGLEVHPHNDQIIRIDQGQGQVQMGPSRDNLNYRRDVYDGCIVCVPKNTWHNIVNRGAKPLKLSTMYAPYHHAPGVIDTTHEMADARED